MCGLSRQGCSQVNDIEDRFGLVVAASGSRHGIDSNVVPFQLALP
jgi:hypothetical protein